MAVGTNARMGYGGALGFDEETTYGVTAAAMTNFIEFNSASFTKTLGNKILESIGSGRGAARRVTTNTEVEGTINFNLHPVNGIKFLKHTLMGTVTSALLSAVTYAHTFTAGNMEEIAQKGLTFQLRPSDTTDAFVITGAKINSLKINAETGGDAVTAEISLIAKGMTSGTFITTGSVTFDLAKPFQPQDVIIQINGNPEDIISMELTYENNLQNDDNARSLGSKTLAILPAQERKLGLSLTQRYDTTTAWNRMINASDVAINIIIDSQEAIGVDETTYQLRCDLPKVYYDSGGPPEISGSGILTHKLDITPILDTLTGGKDIFFSLWNSISGY